MRFYQTTATGLHSSATPAKDVTEEHSFDHNFVKDANYYQNGEIAQEMRRTHQSSMTKLAGGKFEEEAKFLPPPQYQREILFTDQNTPTKLKQDFPEVQAKFGKAKSKSPSKLFGDRFKLRLSQNKHQKSQQSLLNRPLIKLRRKLQESRTNLLPQMLSTPSLNPLQTAGIS